MSNIINLDLYREKKQNQNNQSSKLTKAVKYLEDNKYGSDALDVQLLRYFISELKGTGSMSLIFRTSMIAKYFDTTPYKIKKALNVLIDNGLVDIIDRPQGKPFVISLKSYQLAFKCMVGNQRKLN